MDQPIAEKFRSIVQPRVALLLNHFRSIGDGFLHELDDVGFGLESVTRRIVPSPKSGPRLIRQSSVSGRNPAQRHGEDSEQGALVLLQLKIVLVFGKVLRHGDEFVPDVVPSLRHLLGTRTRRTRRRVLRLGPTVKTRSDGRRRVTATSARVGQFICRFLLI